MLKNSKKFFSIALLALTVMSSCTKQEGCMDPNAVNYDADAEKDCCCEYETNFEMTMQLNNYIGATLLSPGSTYSVNGANVQFDLVKFYISNIRLVDASGNETATDKYLLVEPGTTNYTAGFFPEGDYTKLRFDVGIDSLTNHADPSTYPVNDPLGPQFPSMHWSWDAGYIFIRIDAIADQDGDGTVESPFEMHIGKDSNLRTVEFDVSLNGTGGNNYTTAINVNWLKFFDGVDMTGDLTTHTGDNLDLTALLVGNIEGMFSLAE